MAVRKKKVEPAPTPSVRKEEKPKRVVPEVPNTIHFYSHDQNLIRMESLDKNLKIGSTLLKDILNEIKERQLPGTNLFVVVYNDLGESCIDEIVDLSFEDCDEDLKKIVSKITSPLVEKTEVVE